MIFFSSASNPVKWLPTHGTSRKTAVPRNEVGGSANLQPGSLSWDARAAGTGAVALSAEPARSRGTPDRRRLARPGGASLPRNRRRPPPLGGRRALGSDRRGGAPAAGHGLEHGRARRPAALAAQPRAELHERNRPPRRRLAQRSDRPRP